MFGWTPARRRGRRAYITAFVCPKLEKALDYAALKIEDWEEAGTGATVPAQLETRFQRLHKQFTRMCGGYRPDASLHRRRIPRGLPALTQQQRTMRTHARDWRTVRRMTGCQGDNCSEYLDFMGDIDWKKVHKVFAQKYGDVPVAAKPWRK